MKELKKKGNDYLVELIGDENKFLDYFIDSIYFIDNETIMREFDVINENIKKEEINIVRRTKSKVVYVEKLEDGSFSKKLSDEKRITKLSDENKLFIRENDDFIRIKFDSTGNYNLVKKIKTEFGIDLSKDYKNYTIAHLSDKPSTPLKHSLANIVLIPTFLNKFLDNRGIVLGTLNINVLKVVKAMIFYKFGEPDMYDTINAKYELNENEIKFITDFDFEKLNFLKRP
ncbi:hypothetical protein OF897_12190 [Chryseobacterium formosus]|uniref:HNH endonuclease n=1 Tax=Chryseobacterium formosus TaxID=1537363 RepID=A0ABT3XRB3_9FLAO|nr:hypothetical protein [Chryseobacterium formosus]MCX8524673.1 hypothetical protein [Chryseobacterium formosus]